jgi:hypothetical protein
MRACAEIDDGREAGAEIGERVRRDASADDEVDMAA